MTNLALIRIFKTYLETKMSEYGYPVAIKQAYQPRKVGADTGAALYFFHVNTRRVGHPKRKGVWDEENQKMIFQDIQRTETTFQISGLIPFNETSTYTPADFLFMASHILQADEFRQHLISNEAAILKISEIRNPYFVDEKNRFEANPSFDFTIAYNSVLTRDGAYLSLYEFDFKRV